MTASLLALRAIVIRDVLRFVHQRSRFVAALVRPLIWLVVFAAGFRGAFGPLTPPPHVTPISYEMYILPGLCGMILLFNGMQSALSLVYDREMGSMRILLTSPLPRWWLLVCRLLSSTAISLLQVYAFLLVAMAFGIHIPLAGYVSALPALFLAGLMLGAFGLAMSSSIHQLENFAGVMNFVIFPTFFLSSALYPLAQMGGSSALLLALCELNPFTHAVELIRFAFAGQVNWPALAWILATGAVFLGITFRQYTPVRGLR